MSFLVRPSATLNFMLAIMRPLISKKAYVKLKRVRSPHDFASCFEGESEEFSKEKQGRCNALFSHLKYKFRMAIAERCDIQCLSACVRGS